MFELSKMLSPFLLILTLFLLFLINKFFSKQKAKTSQTTIIQSPKAYPVIGHLIAFSKKKKDERFRYLTDLVVNSPSSTFVLQRPFGRQSIVTGNPATVEHILKTRFPIYQKGPFQQAILRDLLGDGIFNADGEMWKFQRQVASLEFNTKSLRKFVETVVDTEISDRLIPLLSNAAKNRTVLDLQDILQRFAFDNICKIAFGYDPKYLLPSLPQAKFAVAFEDAVIISSQRFRTFFPIIWKTKRILNIGSEKRLKEVVSEIRDFAKSLVSQKKHEMEKDAGKSLSSELPDDLLSRFLKSGHTDETFVTDIVISFILAGRDSTSSALTWFFWLLHTNKHVEEQIVQEINKNRGKQSNRTELSSAFEEVKDMVYTHAALCESMRLYPPVPADAKEATADDVLPDGMRVKKGTWVTYHPYAMGRMKSIWGLDWAEYRPARWLDNTGGAGDGKWRFVPRDPYSYPVFQAGPRVCLGKEMSFLQMKRVAACILENFQVVPAILLIVPLLLLLVINKVSSSSNTQKTSHTSNHNLPKSYPIIGHLISFYQNKDRRIQWLTSLIASSPSLTYVIHRPFGKRSILTANPANVEHILKTQFPIYPKGALQNGILRDLLGDGIFNVDDGKWKFQRKVASHEFNTRSLRKFVETVVDKELSDRLIPILSDAAKNKTVLDLQDILQRFAFDNICKIAFGYDPEYLTPSLPQSKFAVAFDVAVSVSAMRIRTFFPILWKIRRVLNIGHEKELREAVLEVKGFANSIVKQKKQEMMQDSEGTSSSETEDLLSRFLKSGHSDEKFVTDIVISFLLAGRDTTSAALTWFFWLLHKNKHVEEEIVREINKNMGKQNDKTEHSSIFEEVKDMVYTHAALNESMRLYPPVPADTKEASRDDVLPDGTPVKKGMLVTYHPYAMGRMEKLWGPEWTQFQPERWLEVEDQKWKFIPKDPYTYPVFQAGPRICLGKEMAFLQMKRVVAGILEKFRVVPAVEEGFEPVYIPNLTAKMEGGLPVRIEERM